MIWKILLSLSIVSLTYLGLKFRKILFPKVFATNQPVYSVKCHDVNEELENKQTPIMRSKISPSKLVTTPDSNVKTLFDVFQSAAIKYGDAKCFGVRPILDTFTEEKEEKEDGETKTKKFTKYKKGSYEWKSYNEVFSTVKSYGKGLNSLVECVSGDKPLERRIGIFAETSPEWLMIAGGSWSQNLTIVTSLPTLRGKALGHSLGQTKCPVVFTNSHLLPALSEVLDECHSLRTVIYASGPEDEEEFSDAKEKISEKNIRIMTLDHFAKLSDESLGDIHSPSPSDVAAIMYTSGSTGLPKGVVISHGNLVGTIGGVSKLLDHYHYSLTEEDSYLGYLPSSHILELAVELTVFYFGVKIGFGNPKTLTPSGMKDSPTDLKALSPTLFVGVPKVYDNLRKKSLEMLQKQNPLLQKLFWAAFHLKKKCLEVGQETPLLDSLIFRKFRENLGGKVRLAITAGAPLSADTHWFVRIAFVHPVVQLYGLTETCGGGTFLPLESVATERAGAPLPCVEVKLVDLPDMGYRAKDSQGEIYIRGPAVTKEYFDNEEKTKESYKEGGWFATGDVGRWESDGTLSVIDRLSNMIKLPNGEFIGVEFLESKYVECGAVDQVLVHAKSSEPFPVAIVVPKEGALQHSDVKSKEPRDEMLDKLKKQAKSAGLSSAETVKGVIIAEKPWNEENGRLSGAGKLQRKKIEEDYKDELEDIFAKSSE